MHWLHSAEKAALQLAQIYELYILYQNYKHHIKEFYNTYKAAFSAECTINSMLLIFISANLNYIQYPSNMRFPTTTW